MMIVSSVTTARQVVELSGPEARRPGPVSQRGLYPQESGRPPGIVKYLLPRQPRGRSCPDLAVAGHHGDLRKAAAARAKAAAAFMSEFEMSDTDRFVASMLADAAKPIR